MTPRLTVEQNEALRRLANWAADQKQIQQAEIQPLCEFDSQGNPIEITDCGGQSIHHEYDIRGRLTKTIGADGAVSHYHYDDALDRLTAIDRDGRHEEFQYDASGRVQRISQGDAGTAVFSWDDKNQVVAARNSRVDEQYTYDEHGRLIQIRQVRDGVALVLSLSFDENGRLSELHYPDSVLPVSFKYDEQGWPCRVTIGSLGFAQYTYDKERRAVEIQYSNDVSEESKADPVDRRPLSQVLSRNSDVVQFAYEYDAGGRLVSDSKHIYEYDAVGRLTGVVGEDGSWAYSYDAADNRIEPSPPSDLLFDPRARVFSSGGRVFRYDDADRLVEIVRDGVVVVECGYDHKGRMVMYRTKGRCERFIYGPTDELYAVTDESGRALRLYVRTPYGPLAVVNGSLDHGKLTFLHCDMRGTARARSDADGLEEISYEAFGLPLDDGPDHVFMSRLWFADAGLYYFGARWYDPVLGRFLTPDTYTCGPDDERLINPLVASSQQAITRLSLLPDWLKQPRARNLYAFCANDPVNRADPNGHWSFGGVLLSILGAIWTLPNTIFGLFLEITCLVGEVIRWLVWLVTFGHVSWATPGFDVAASGRLNAFALVFRGGWLGSFSRLGAITFGNVFFVYHDWENFPELQPPGDLVPLPAYGGSVSIPKRDTLYEHELRHTNQYGWLGPFFHLGLPVFGFFWWDLIANGYRNSILERDAQAHGGLP